MKFVCPSLVFVVSVYACSSGNPKKTETLVKKYSSDSVQIVLNSIDSNHLPSEIILQGQIDSIISWTDRTGTYITIQTQSGILNNNDLGSGELFTYCFKLDRTSNQYKRLWHLHDFINNCQADIEVEFIPNTFRLTDLNKNGIPEIWSMYKTACHGDISPCEMKIILFEGMKKMAMRGRNRVETGNGKYDGGEYVMDKSLSDADSTLINYAGKLWTENINQKWD